MRLACFVDHVPSGGEKVIAFFAELVDGPEILTRGELIQAQIFLRQLANALHWGWSRPNVVFKDLAPPPVEKVVFFKVTRRVSEENWFSTRYEAVEFTDEKQQDIIMRAINNASTDQPDPGVRNPQAGRDRG